jgi:hypothetical protein
LIPWRQLRAAERGLDHVDLRLDELTTNIGSPERHVALSTLRIASLKVDFSAMQSRLDTTDRRIARIERHLELTEVATH